MQRLRQEQARPILEKLHGYLQGPHATALPKSLLATAIGYALRNWAALARYTEDGRLKMDNNGAEQALRPIVLGRKNYLFAGSEAAAHRTAILCSLVQTCKHLKSIRSCTCAMSSIVCPRIRSGWSWSLRHASGSASARILWHKPRPERLSFRAKALWRTGFRGHPIVVGVLWDLLRDLVVT